MTGATCHILPHSNPHTSSCVRYDPETNILVVTCLPGNNAHLEHRCFSTQAPHDVVRALFAGSYTASFLTLLGIRPTKAQLAPFERHKVVTHTFWANHTHPHSLGVKQWLHLSV